MGGPSSRPHGLVGGALRIDRRSLLGAGACAAVAGLATPALARVHAAGPAAPRYVITDRRYPQSLAFARFFEDRGAARLEVADGLTRLWQDDLVPLWRQAGGTVVGLTSRGIWDCLSEQASGQFRKARLIGRHMIDGNGGRTTHIVTAPEAALRAAGGDLGGMGWMEGMARLTSRCSPDTGACAEWRCGPPAPASAATQSLLSWMIV